MASVLDRLIDKATGFDPNHLPNGKVWLACPKCKRRMITNRDKTDHPKTHEVRVLCDRCDDGGSFPEVAYYDAEGKWLAPDHF